MSDFPYEDAVMHYSPDESTAENTSSSVGQVKQKHEQELIAIDGVEGVGVGKNEIGDDAIIVYLREPGVVKRIPKNIEGHPVVVHITGPIEAL